MLDSEKGKELPVRRREILEQGARYTGIIALIVGGGLGYVLAMIDSVLIYTGLLILAITILNFVFIFIVRWIEEKLDIWERAHYAYLTEQDYRRDE